MIFAYVPFKFLRLYEDFMNAWLNVSFKSMYILVKH